jgi:branched-chain amino acid transport system permease protein
MSTTWLPCGTYHENYRKDQSWFQTKLIRGKMLVLLLVLIGLPFVEYGLLPNWILRWFNTGTFCLIGYLILGALGVQLLIGYCGQITLGHAAFVGVGAYVSTLFMKIPLPWAHQLGIVFPVSIIFAGIIAGLLSVLFGLPSARVKGFYLIMTTIAAQWVIVNFLLGKMVPTAFGTGGWLPLQDVISSDINPSWQWKFLALPQDFSFWTYLTGQTGLVAEASRTFGPAVGPIKLQGGLNTYYVTLALIIICFAVVANLLRSKVGRAWVAIRDNDIAAEALGINIVYYKLLAFFVAGFIGGVSGSALVAWNAAVTPEYFDWAKSLWLVGYILIGGVGSLYGVVFGTVFITFIVQILAVYSGPIGDFIQFFLPFINTQNIKAGIELIVLGLSICLFLMYEPNGMSYRWWQVKNYFNLWPFSY